MAIEQNPQGKFLIYKDSTLKDNVILEGTKGKSTLDSGYVFAPYIPLYIVPTITIATDAERKATVRKIKKIMRIPAAIIKTAMKRAGYKINKDFIIRISKDSAIIHVDVFSGHRFTHDGICQVHCNKGKLNIFWTYEPTPGSKAHDEVDIVLADPNCYGKIVDTIVKATEACRITRVCTPKDLVELYSGPVDPLLYGKVTI